MAFTYTPSANALTTLTLPNDGDNDVVASVNGPFQCLGDAIAYLTAHLTILSKYEVIDANTYSGTSGTAIVPVNASNIIVEMWGGGGGGGPGIGAAANFSQNTGGAGGGGARRYVGIFAVGPGQQLTFFVAGAAAAYTRGADSYLQNTTLSIELMRARGGARGSSAYNSDQAATYVPTGPTTNSVANQYAFVRGGDEAAPLTTATRGGFSTPTPWSVEEPRPQCGGWGTCTQLTNLASLALAIYGTGGCSPEGFNGGQPGSAGAPYGTPTSSGIYGGGAGGGGGAGPGGAGGQGGNGSAGVNSGTPIAGGAGLQAAAGSGAGGGGGGSAGGTGDWATTPGAGGAGGLGAGGTMRIWTLGRV